MNEKASSAGHEMPKGFEAEIIRKTPTDTLEQIEATRAGYNRLLEGIEDFGNSEKDKAKE